MSLWAQPSPLLWGGPRWLPPGAEGTVRAPAPDSPGKSPAFTERQPGAGVQGQALLLRGSEPPVLPLSLAACSPALGSCLPTTPLPWPAPRPPLTKAVQESEFSSPHAAFQHAGSACPLFQAFCRSPIEQLPSVLWHLRMPGCSVLHCP